MLKSILGLLMLVALVAGGYWAWQQFRPQQVRGSEIPRWNIVQARRGPIQVTVAGNGVVAAAQQEEMRVEQSGTLVRLLVAEGDKVTAGQRVAGVVDNDAELSNQRNSLQREKNQLNLESQQQQLLQLVDQVAGLEVRATADGRVNGLKLVVGQDFNKGALAANIASDQLVVSALFNPVQIQTIRLGQAADVFVQDFLTTIAGTVIKVDNRGQPGVSGGITYQATVAVNNPGALQVGHQALVTVLTDTGPQQAVATSKLAMNEPTEVRVPVAGTITELLVAEGTMVDEGQLLARLKNDSLLNDIRNKELQIKQLQLDLSSHEIRPVSSEVKAPISGTIASLNLKGGEDVKAGTLLGAIADYSRLQVVVPVDELDIAKLQVGQAAQIKVSALPDQPFAAKVAAIAMEGRAQSGVATFDVTLAVDAPGNLKVGMTANAEILVASKQNALLLPVEALQQQQGLKVVAVMEAAAAEGEQARPNLRQVEIGLHNESQIEITSGLQEGEQVVVVTATASSSRAQLFQNMGFGGMGGSMGGVTRALGGARPGAGGFSGGGGGSNTGGGSSRPAGGGAR